MGPARTPDRRARGGDRAPADAAGGRRGRRQERAGELLDRRSAGRGRGGLALAGPRRRRPAPLLARGAGGAQARRRARARRVAQRPSVGDGRAGDRRAGQRARRPERARWCSCSTTSTSSASGVGGGGRRPPAAPSARRAADRDRHPFGPAAAARAAPDRRDSCASCATATSRSPRRRPRSCSRRAACACRRRRADATLAPDGGLGGRTAARDADAAHPPRAGGVRRSLRRRRRDRRGLPAGRGAGTAAAGAARLPAADLRRRRALGGARGCDHRAARRASCRWRGSSASMRSCRRSVPTAHGSATTRCSPSCCARSCASRCRTLVGGAAPPRGDLARRQLARGAGAAACGRRRRLGSGRRARGRALGAAADSAASSARSARRSRSCRASRRRATRRWPWRSPACGSTRATRRAPRCSTARRKRASGCRSRGASASTSPRRSSG